MDLTKIAALPAVLMLALMPVPGGAGNRIAPDDGPTRPPAWVEAGNVQLTGTLVPGGEPFPGTVFTVLRDEPRVFGQSRHRVVASGGPQTHAVFRLNPGRYRVEARNGAVTTHRFIEVPDIHPVRQEIVLDAGELHLRGLLHADGPDATETWFRVLREERDAYGRPVQVPVAERGYAGAASFVVPAGDYLAVARYGDARAEVPVRVVAGRVTEQALVLDAGLLTVSATLDGDGEPVTGVQFRVDRRRRVDGAPDGDTAGWEPVTAGGGRDGIAFALPAGDYRIRAELDRVAAEVRVSLSAGESRHLALPLNAGRLTLLTSLDATAASQPLLDAWFDVMPADGPAGTAASTPLGPTDRADFVVPAGRYLASARVGRSEHSVTLDVAAGSEQAIDIVQDAGRVRLALVTGSSDDPLPHVWFSIYRVERDAQGGITRRRVYNEGYLRAAEVVLPAGDYVAFAQQRARRGELGFELAPGETRHLAIVAGD